MASDSYLAPGKGAIIGIVAGIGILAAAGIATAVVLKKRGAATQGTSPNIDEIKQKDEPIRDAGGADNLKIKMLPWSNAIFAVIPTPDPSISWNTAPVSLAGGKRAAFDELDTYLFQHSAEYKDILAINKVPAFAGSTQMVSMKPIDIGSYMLALKVSWRDEGQDYTDAMRQADSQKYKNTWLTLAPQPKTGGSSPVKAVKPEDMHIGTPIANPWLRYECRIGGKKPDNVPGTLDSWGPVGSYNPIMWRPNYGFLKNLLWDKTWEGPIFRIKYMKSPNLIMMFQAKFSDNPGNTWTLNSETVGVELYGWRSKMHPISQISELRKEIIANENTWNNCGSETCSFKYDGAHGTGVDRLIDNVLNQIQYHFNSNIFRGF